METYYTWQQLFANLSLVETGYFGRSLRSLFISFTIFSPSTGLWVAWEFFYEISVVGLVNPTHAIIKPFKPNILETGREKGLWAAEYLRLVGCLYIFAILIIRKIVKVKSLAKLFDINIIIDLILDLSIVSYSITIFILVFILGDKSTQECIDAVDFTDFVQKAYWYNVIFILESFLLLFIVIKFLQLNVSRSLNVQLKSFTNSIKVLISYSVIIFPVLLCIAIIWMKIWGTFSSDYRTFGKAFISLSMLLLGRGDSYLTICVFLAIFAYNYGLTLLAYGYPDGKILFSLIFLGIFRNSKP